MSKSLDLKDKNTIADLQIAFKDIAKQYPLAIRFLEYYCGFDAPLNTSDPYTISYSGGKRDVYLMIKTLMRDDILPEQLANFYERNI